MIAIPFAAKGDPLSDALAGIAAALRYPVLACALLVLIAGAVELGRFATELWQRRAARARHGTLRTVALHVVRDPGRAAALAVGAAPTAFAAQALRQIAAALVSGRSVALEHALADYELAAQRRLDRTRILVRAGPAIGLMGTLIPLAPGLAALGRGDVAGLAADLRTAFAATVIGLLVGTVAFALTLTRTRLYTEDLTALERAVAAAGREGAGPAAPTGAAPPTAFPGAASPAAPEVAP